ncbi:ABC transporter permease [Kitasatospora sp. NPDC048194]|uniref:ABC transporter permease n=1 Tax=Kitasatospora sp. NPDC048194 TaxID=3364045 RepID=UPI0037230753
MNGSTTEAVRTGVRPAFAAQELERRRPIRALRSIAAAARLQVKVSSMPQLVVSSALQPVVFIVVVLTAAGPHGADRERVVLGGALLAIWSAVVWQAGLTLKTDLWLGTLPGICSRNLGLAAVAIGRSLAASSIAAVVIVCAVTVTSALLGALPSIADPVGFTLAAVLTWISALAMSLLLACLLLLSRKAIRVAEALVYPVFILGGLLVPLDVLPAWLRPLSSVLSLRWGGELLSDAAAGRPGAASAWCWLLLLVVAYAVLARVAFAIVLHRTRKEGSLEYH